MSKTQKRALPYSVSQNYLTSCQTIDRLTRIAGLKKTDTVLEIGAGKGHITRPLSEKCGRVVSYEIDPRLYERLKGQLNANVQLRCADFLQCRPPREPYLVFANIPFCITTQIVRKLTTADPLPQGMWLIMEKGAAKRFCGMPSESLASLLIKARFDARIVYRFRREDFHPAPGVDVVMLEFRRKGAADVPAEHWEQYAAFVRHGLQYGFFGKKALLSRRQMDTALRLEGLSRLKPSGEVLYIQWQCLFREWLRLKTEKSGF